ncbi:MAG TPA: cupin domain-containing protein [Alphaproteobacteria bacterium]|jgi:mannose-6-phosphate isomerase-like protein (cupin superfamily)|nr:cupin domain-containing protein [Alphaproteobacteria bacterium]MDP6271413.1 cupin domain-containing protein [Alphaproteobacteria bacterium]HJM50922.1 cupin domain-containing protein [Alphaproteobacteria bacterium]
MEAVNIAEKFDLFSDHWKPRIVGRFNDTHVKLAKLEGEFVWHSHADTDEFFLVHRGELTIEMRQQSVTLRAGEFFVVPRGVEHRPLAAAECEIVMIEAAGTLNTGEAGGSRTVADPEWL